MNTIDNYLLYQKDTLLFQINEDNVNLRARVKDIELENTRLNHKLSQLYEYVDLLHFKQKDLQLECDALKCKLLELEQLITSK